MNPRYGRYTRVDIMPATPQYPKGPTSVRTECVAAAFCTSAEEVQNFANWYSYYRIRMTMMKTITIITTNTKVAKVREEAQQAEDAKNATGKRLEMALALSSLPSTASQREGGSALGLAIILLGLYAVYVSA